MAVSLNDQFFLLDPASPPPVGSNLQVQDFDLVDANEDGDISPNSGDTFNGLEITRVWLGDTITVNIPGQGEVTIEGVTFYLDGGSPVFTPTDGSKLEDAEFVGSTYVVTSTQVAVEDLEPVCFVKGSLIETKAGPTAVETLKPGDLIQTRDHGFARLQGVYTGRFPARGAFAPVRICKNALGNDQDLWVSQQHRILITGWRAELHFAAEEVLVAAKHLVNGDTIHIPEGGVVDYFHLLFDRHEIVQSAGLWSESYLPRHFQEYGPPVLLDEAYPASVHTPHPLLSLRTARPVVPGYAAGLVVPAKEKSTRLCNGSRAFMA